MTIALDEPLTSVRFRVKGRTHATQLVKMVVKKGRDTIKPVLFLQKLGYKDLTASLLERGASNHVLELEDILHSND